MNTSTITKSALALAFGLCATGALAERATPVSEDFQGAAFNNGNTNTVAGITANNLAWADPDGYTAVESGVLKVDATTNAPTAAAIASDAKTKFDSAVTGNRSASFTADVAFTPSKTILGSSDIADGGDLKFALFAYDDGTSTNLYYYTSGTAASTGIEVTENALHALVVNFSDDNGTRKFSVSYNGSVAAGPYAFAHNAQVEQVEFAGNGSVDNIAFAYDLVPFSLQWPAGYTAVSYTVAGGASQSISGSSPASIDVEDGDVVTFTFQNADGAEKTLTATAVAGSVTSIDASSATFGWADYLGAAVDGAYQIDNLDELVRFQKGVAAGLATSGETFKLTADIALVNPWPGVGTYDNTTNADAFEGTFDGAGHRISNVVFANASFNNYRGFFNQVYNATIKDLTIQWAGWEAGITGEYGGAALVGCANNSTLLRLVAEGTIASGAHNNAGIVVRASGLTSPTTISCCTNKMAITGNYTKVAGICALTQAGTSTVTFDACVNEGAITAATAAGLANAGRDGLAGILAYAANGDGNTIINACVNTGTIDGTSGFSGVNNGYTGAKAGQLLGWAYNTVSLTGANTVKDNYLAVGAYISGKTTGQNFATVSGTTATMIADANVVAGATQYKAMTEKAAFTFAAAGTLIVDEALKAATVTAPGLVLSDSTSGTVKTYTARDYAVVTVTVNGGANATAAWTVDGVSAAAPANLTEGQTYAVTYTANEGYEFAAGAVTSASGTAGTENITITIDDAVASIEPYVGGEGGDEMTVSGGTHELTTAEASYLNDLVEAKGGNTAAQAAVEAAVAQMTEEEFVAATILNQDVTEDDAGSYTFKIKKIAKSGSTVTVTASLIREGTIRGDIRGTATLYTCDTPNGTYTKQAAKTFDLNEEAGNEATASVTFTGVNKFFKVVIE